MRQFLLVALAVTLPSVGNAAAKLETNYTIGSTTAESKTEIKSLAKEKLIRGFLFSEVRKALENSTYISTIQETEGKVDKEDNSYSSSIAHKKNSNIFVSMVYPSKLSMLFSVEQSYNECKPASAATVAAAQYNEHGDSYGSSGSGECYLDSVVKVKGPMMVYGNYATHLNIETLMKDKQELTFDLDKMFDGSGIRLTSRFSITSNLFEENLFEFMKFFGIAPEDTSQQAVTRQRMLLGVSRYLRQVNERVLQ